MDRRNFMKTLGAAGLFTIVPRKVLGGKGFVAPSDQLTKAIIGVGGIGRSSIHFSSSEACRLLAVCDVDKKHLNSAVEAAKTQLKENVKEEDSTPVGTLTLKKILGGDLLGAEMMRKQVGLFVLIVFFVIVYVGFRYQCQQDLIKIDDQLS